MKPSRRPIALRAVLKFVFFSVIFIGCQSNDPFQKDANFGDESFDLYREKAKSWYNNRMQKIAVSNARLKGEAKPEPNWDKIEKRKSKNGKEILIAETVGFELENEKYELYRVFVFKLEKEQVVTGRILEFIGEKSSLRKSQNFTRGVSGEKNGRLYGCSPNI